MKNLILLSILFALTFFISCQESSSVKVRNIASIQETGRLNDPVIEKMLLDSNSVDDFLSKVKGTESTKKYLKNFIPVWKSASLQQSFWFCPRVLMFNEDASFIFSIIDCPYYTQERDDVEILQWSSEKRRYELYSVHFRLNGKNIVETYDYYRKRNKEVHLGEENPAECLRCHRGGIAIGVYDPFFFSTEYPEWWMENLDYLKNKISVDKEFVKRSGYRIPITRYGDFFEVGELHSQFPSKSKFIKNAMARYEQPIHRFNFLLAEKNHLRTYEVMKEQANLILGEDGWDTIKYSTVAALAGCENYTEMVKKDNALFPPFSRDYLQEKIDRGENLNSLEKQGLAVFDGGFKNFSNSEREEQEDYSDIAIGIYKRIGFKRLFSDYLSTENKFEKLNKNRQMYGIAKFYHAWYTHWTEQKNMRQAVLQVNLNTIKFAMHPAWGVGNLVFHILKNDQDLSDLSYIGDFSARDYLNIMNGIKDYEVFSVNDEIRSKRSISYSRDREEFERIMYNGGLKRTENDPAFNTFCSSLESKFIQATVK